MTIKRIDPSPGAILLTLSSCLLIGGCGFSGDGPTPDPSFKQVAADGSNDKARVLGGKTATKGTDTCGDTVC